VPHKKLAYEQGVQKALQDAGLMEKEAQESQFSNPLSPMSSYDPSQKLNPARPAGLRARDPNMATYKDAFPEGKMDDPRPFVPGERDATNFVMERYVPKGLGKPGTQRTARAAKSKSVIPQRGPARTPEQTYRGDLEASGLTNRNPSMRPGGLRASLTPYTKRISRHEFPVDDAG
jgi:hypothetical protein